MCAIPHLQCPSLIVRHLSRLASITRKREMPLSALHLVIIKFLPLLDHY